MNVPCRKNNGGTKMTRKQALSKAIDILSKDTNNDEIVSVLKNLLSEYPYSRWEKETVIDSITQYAIEHNGCLPQVHDLRQENRLPSTTVIKYLFEYSSVNLFYEKYFPEYKIEGYASPYRLQTRDFFISIFKKNYDRIKLETGVRIVDKKKYNQKRETNTPIIKTILRNCKLDDYKQLLIECGYMREQKPIECSIDVSYNTEESFDDLNDIIKNIKVMNENK